MVLVSAVKHTGAALWASCCCGTQLRVISASPLGASLKVLFMPEGPLSWKLRILRERDRGLRKRCEAAPSAAGCSHTYWAWCARAAALSWKFWPTVAWRTLR